MDILALITNKSQRIIAQTIKNADGRWVTRRDLMEAMGRHIEQQDFNFIQRLAESGAIEANQDSQSKVWHYRWIGD